MTDGTINGSLFSGGLDSTATVKGNTLVSLTGKTTVDKNVYGGGNGGEVDGNTNVVIE